MSKSERETSYDSFLVTLTKALDHFSNAQWLAKNSPLATPYFLGQYLLAESGQGDIETRGRALQTVILNALHEMWPDTLPSTRKELVEATEQAYQLYGNKGSYYHFLLLELCYVRQYFSSRTKPLTSPEIIQFLNVAPSRFYVHRQKSIEALGEILLLSLRPTFRLERPLLVTQLVGRDELRNDILASLYDRRSVFLSGVGGSGKTSLGSAIVEVWPAGCVFWYTFYPGLNDDLHSVLFSLGHFLNQWGQSGLWMQLLAGQGEPIDISQALGFLRDDLKAIVPVLPLICFDEVDRLVTSTNEPHHKKHDDVIEFIESLCDLQSTPVPLLLIGQRAVFDTADVSILHALNEEQSQELLTNAGIHLEQSQMRHIFRYTEGNPRLLELFAVLISKSDNELSDLLQIPKSPSARPLFSRLWRRLDMHEQKILRTLSVIRTVAPANHWKNNHLSLNSLINRQLLKENDQEGVFLLPFFQQLILSELSGEEVTQAHQEAASIRMQYAEHTAAAYHLLQAKEYSMCVHLWYEHHESEIQRGQANAARDMFSALPAQELDDAHKRKLKFINNRLARLIGDAHSIVDGMNEIELPKGEELSGDVYGQFARAETNLGNADGALQNYDHAIEIFGNLCNKIIDMHSMRGQLFVRNADLQSARHEIELARYQTEQLHGIVELMAGNLREAHTHLQNTLTLAQTINDEDKTASAHYVLLLVTGRRNQVQAAEKHAQLAMDYFEKIGNRIQLEGTRAELAGVYINARQFEQVIEPAEQALAFFEKIKHERRIPAICNTLAEAYFETGHIEKAKEYTFRVLEYENPRSHPYALYTLGLVHQQENNLEHAETSFTRGIEISQGNEDKFIEAHLHQVLSKLYLQQNKHNLSQSSLNAANALFRQMGLDQE